LIIMLVALLPTVGCGPATGPDEAASKTGTGELRTDPEPLRKRFPELGATFEARWMSGEYGSGRAPGPTTYWIDAVITLPSDRVADLTAEFAPADTSDQPAVVDGLRSQLPAGPALTGPALDRAFAPAEGATRAFLYRTDSTLVLVSTLG
jgi:hypothetical protein